MFYLSIILSFLPNTLLSWRIFPTGIFPPISSFVNFCPYQPRWSSSTRRIDAWYAGIQSSILESNIFFLGVLYWMIESPSRKQPEFEGRKIFFFFFWFEREAAKLGWPGLGARSAPICVLMSLKRRVRAADNSHYFLIFSIGIVGLWYNIERCKSYSPFFQESVPSERVAEIRPRLLSEERGLVSIFKFFIFSMLKESH